MHSLIFFCWHSERQRGMLLTKRGNNHYTHGTQSNTPIKQQLHHSKKERIKPTQIGGWAFDGTAPQLGE